MEADIENSDNTTAISVAVSRLNISELASITRLKVITEGEAYLTPEDNVYIKENFTSLTYLDESNCKCSTRKLAQAYLDKSGLPDVGKLRRNNIAINAQVFDRELCFWELFGVENRQFTGGS